MSLRPSPLDTTDTRMQVPLARPGLWTQLALLLRTPANSRG